MACTSIIRVRCNAPQLHPEGLGFLVYEHCSQDSMGTFLVDLEDAVSRA